MNSNRPCPCLSSLHIGELAQKQLLFRVKSKSHFIALAFQLSLPLPTAGDALSVPIFHNLSKALVLSSNYEGPNSWQKARVNSPQVGVARRQSRQRSHHELCRQGEKRR